MREYKFRGKREDANVWVYGYVFKTHKANPWSDETTWIFNENGKFKVEPETVGQYTGLKDKNVVEIYEGDIIIKPANRNRHLEVVFSDDVACFEAIHSVGARSLNGYVKSDGGVLIIGNRWDYPELLEPHT